MEPAVMEMNVPVALAVVIGMIGFLSWTLLKNFEKNIRVNSTMSGYHVVEEINETDTSTESVDAEETAACDGDCSNCECTLAPPPPLIRTSPSGVEAVEAVEAEVEAEEETESDGEVDVSKILDPFTQIHTDIDAATSRLRRLTTRLRQPIIW